MLDKFINIFEGATEFYGQAKRIHKKLSVKVEVKAWTHTKSPITREQWRLHLEGVEPQLGIAPLKKDGTCKWGAIDIDINHYDYQELLNKIRKLNLPLILNKLQVSSQKLLIFLTIYLIYF